MSSTRCVHVDIKWRRHTVCHHNVRAHIHVALSSQAKGLHAANLFGSVGCKFMSVTVDRKRYRGWSSRKRWKSVGWTNFAFSATDHPLRKKHDALSLFEKKTNVRDSKRLDSWEWHEIGHFREAPCCWIPFSWENNFTKMVTVFFYLIGRTQTGLGSSITTFYNKAAERTDSSWATVVFNHTMYNCVRESCVM